MTGEDRADVGDEAWAQAGRELLFRELSEVRFDLEEAFHEAEEAIYGECEGEGRFDGELRPEHIQALRQALHNALKRVEGQAAPVAGVEPWAEVPPIPIAALWERVEYPNADDVEPSDYLDDAEVDDA